MKLIFGRMIYRGWQNSIDVNVSLFSLSTPPDASWFSLQKVKTNNQKKKNKTVYDLLGLFRFFIDLFSVDITYLTWSCPRSKVVVSVTFFPCSHFQVRFPPFFYVYHFSLLAIQWTCIDMSLSIFSPFPCKFDSNHFFFISTIICSLRFEKLVFTDIRHYFGRIRNVGGFTRPGHYLFLNHTKTRLKFNVLPSVKLASGCLVLIWIQFKFVRYLSFYVLELCSLAGEI